MSRLRFNALSASPASAPAPGKLELYALSADKQLYWIDDAGTVVNLVGVTTTDALTNKTLVLPAGTTSVSPIQYTSGQNLTVAAAGATEYDGAVFYTTSDTTNGRRYNDNWNYFQLRGTGSAITGIADFFGSTDAIPTVSSGVYEIEWHCYFAITVASTGTSTWTIVNTQTVTNMVANWVATPVAGFATQGTMTGAGVLAQTNASVALPASAALTIANHYHKITALIEANAAGNVRLRQTMSAGTSTPQRGSFFRVRRLPAANVGTFAA